MSNEKFGAEEFKSGFTWRSFLALMYSLCVFSPAVIWLDLVTLGVGLAGVIPYCTLFLFAELARMTGKPLTKQEAAIIFGPAATAGSAGFLTLIYRAWLVKQPMLHVFKINPVDIPAWFAPPVTSKVYEMRTFLHSDIFMPVLILVVTWFLGLCGALFFASFLRELYIEGERLPFPIQQITVDAIESLTERRGERIDVLAVSAVLAFMYSFILYTVPTFTSAIGYPIPTIPVPWVDLTLALQLFLPGAALGIATDALVFSQGFVLPANVILGMLAGSFVRFLVINPALVKFGWTKWAEMWTSGMDFTQIFQYSTLYFWLNPLIGVGFAVGIVPILWRARTFVDSFKVFLKGRSALQEERISGPPFPPLIVASLFVIGCVGALILDVILVPDFPIWLLAIYEMVLPFVVGAAMGRMIGITGQAPDIPYLNQLIILGGVAQGYKKVDAWFLPLSLNPGTMWMTNMKVCQLTRTTIKSWVIASVISYIVALLIGFIYTSLIWQLSPIPSIMYPAPAIMWPIQAMNQLVWITRPAEYFDTYFIVISFMIFGALISADRFMSLPFSMASMAVGLNMPIPVILTMTVGFIIGKVFAQIFGKERFNKYRTTIAAGIGLGEGLAIVFGVMAALSAKSIWPY